jgi:NADPH:quinone reductase-like Zn-dependent oxidoreductase
MRIYVGLRKPRRITILGQELAGEIEAVGKDVKRFRAGDQVFGTTGLGFGAYAEYICLPENTEMGVLTTKPTNMTYEEAAAVPTGGLEALHFIRKANLRRGEKVLILGAGGSIGTFAVQLARYFGAQVTGVDSTSKLEMLRSIGADHVIDYTQEDFTSNGETYLLANPGLSQMLRGSLTSMRSSKKVIFGAANQKVEDLNFIKALVESGKIKSVIDRCYPFEEIVAAHRYVNAGHKKGNVVITLD